MFKINIKNDIVISFKKRFNTTIQPSKREEQYKEKGLSYLTFFLIYHRWAYYLCCLPYKFVRDEKGKFKIQKCKLQQFLNFIQSILYAYNIFKYCISTWVELVRQNSHRTERAPVSYLGIVESTYYFQFSLVVVYFQIFRGSRALKFLKKLDRYSKKYPSENPASGVIIKLPAKKWFVHILMALLVSISLLDYCLQSNFVFTGAQSDAYNFLLWSEFSANKYSKSVDITLLVLHLLIQSIASIRVMFNELYFLAGTMTFWMISCDFESSVEKVCKRKPPSDNSPERKPLQEFRDCANKYRRISKLCRSWNRAYGYSMLSHVASYQMYYAMGFDRLFLDTSSLGVKFYELEFLVGFCLIYGLGVKFSHKMTCLKRLLEDSKILNKLTPRKLNMTIHMVRSNHCTIKAKTFPLTFSSFNQFLGQIMVVFLIAIQIKMMNAVGGFGLTNIVGLLGKI